MKGSKEFLVKLFAGLCWMLVPIASTMALPNIAGATIQSVCGSTLDFNGGNLPADWSVVTISKAALANDRMEAYTTDGSIRIGANLQIPAGTNELVVKYTAYHPYTYWGTTNTLLFKNIDGEIFQRYLSFSAANRLGKNNLAARINNLQYPTWQDPAAQVINPFTYGIYNMEWRISEKGAWIKATSQSDGKVVMSEYLPVSISFGDVSSIDFVQGTTTDNNTWLDDLSFSCDQITHTIVCSEPNEDISNSDYTSGNYICVATDSITPNRNVSVGENAALFLGSPRVELGIGFHVSDGGTLAIATKENYQGLDSGIEQVIIRGSDDSYRIGVLSGQTLETGPLDIVFKEGFTDKTLTFSLETGPPWLVIEQQTGSLTVSAPVVTTRQVAPFSLKVTTVIGSESVVGNIYVSPIELAETHITTGEAETVSIAGVTLIIPAGEMPAGMDIQVVRGTTASGNGTIIVKSNNGQLAGKQFNLTLPENTPSQNVNGLRNAASSNECEPNAPYPVALSASASASASESESKRYFLYGTFRMGEGQQNVEITTDVWDAIAYIITRDPDYLIDLGVSFIDDIIFEEKWGYVLCSKVPTNEIPNEAIDREPVLFFHGYTPFSAFGGGKGTSNNLFDILYGTGQILPFEFRWRTNASFVDVARDLRESVKEIKRLTEKDVHIVAHSFGGLLARTYLQGLDYGRKAGDLPPVASLTTVGAPHSGIFSGKTPDGFPDGRDESITGDGIAACIQTSCWEAGLQSSKLEPIFSAISTIDEGGIPRALNSPENRFPDQLPVQSLMGARREVGDSINWGLPFSKDPITFFTGGDGLLSFEGQRFRPSYRSSMNLLGSQTNSGTPVLQQVLGADVREALLTVDSDDPSIEGSPVSIFDFPGFGHTKFHRICDNGDGGPRAWLVNKALILSPALSILFYCSTTSQQALEGEVYVRNAKHPLVSNLLYWLEQFPSQSSPRSVSISATHPNASETGAIGKIAFQLSTPALWDIVVSYDLSGTATTVLDYFLVGGTSTSITIPASSTQAILEIHPVDDSKAEPGGETVIAKLEAGPDYSLGSLTAAIVNITDNDTAPPPPSTSNKLNDTGITTCSDASTNGLSCPQVNYPGQDAEYGRDVTHNDDSDGHAGFSFTKLNGSGNPLSASATAWSCVKDNVTGLIWEVKTNDGGLQDKENTYTWYNPDSDNNGGNAGTQNGGSCIDSSCDTQGFVLAINAQSLCGANDWRMPSIEELRSLVNYSEPHPGPTIDTNYFPHIVDSIITFGSDLWSSETSAGLPHRAWRLDFSDSGIFYGLKTGGKYVRLVRSKQ